MTQPNHDPSKPRANSGLPPIRQKSPRPGAAGPSGSAGGAAGDPENPFASPAESEPPPRQPIQGRRAQSLAFIQLAFQFKFLGAVALLFALLMFLGGALGPAGLLVAGGGAFLLTGYGIGAYKPWGWHAGVILVVPLLAITSILALLFALFYGSLIAIMMLVMLPLYCYYTVWTLFSRAGRQRYEDSVGAVAAAKANPDSVVGRFYNRR